MEELIDALKELEKDQSNGHRRTAAIALKKAVTCLGGEDCAKEIIRRAISPNHWDIIMSLNLFDACPVKLDHLIPWGVVQKPETVRGLGVGFYA